MKDYLSALKNVHYVHKTISALIALKCKLLDKDIYLRLHPHLSDMSLQTRAR